MAISINVLLVAGGGGGSSSGWGAGWFIETSNALDFSGSYPITVGTGGVGGSRGDTNSGANGLNSSFDGLVAIGGAWWVPNNSNGTVWGSGSGGAANGGWTTTGGAGTSWQGNSGGGNGGNIASPYPAGGGGGSGWTGSNASAWAGGNGGVGTSSSISGTATFYAGWGGGGTAAGGWTWGTGGNGGGGNGSSGWAGSNGTANTGGGGGGAGSASKWGDGGSGIAIIAYVTGTLTATGGTVTTSGGNTIHTFTSSGTFTVTSLPNKASARLGQALSAGTSATSFLLRMDGDVVDSSGNAVNATATNVAWGKWRNGNGSATGNGSNSIITTPLSSSVNGTWAQTFWCWVKFASLPTSGNSMIFMMRGDISADWGFMLRADNTGWTTRLNAIVSAASDFLAVWPVITTGKWYYVVGKYASNTVKVYVNGRLMATTSTSGTLRTSSSRGMQFLGILPSGWTLDGSMDEAFHETKDRSDAYIRKRYTYAVGKFATL